MRIRLWLLIVIMLVLTACGGGSSTTYTASGVIQDVDEKPIEAVTLVFDGYGTAQTNTQGEWIKSGLQGEVTVTPVKENYEFTPPNQTVTPTYARQVLFVGSATSLTITPTEVTMQVDEIQDFIASGRDKYGQPVAVNPNWIVTGGIGFASPAKGGITTFTATTPGEGTVVAEDGDMVVYAIVKVLPRKEAYEIDVTHAIASTPVEEIGGKVTATVDDESYDYGDTVTLTATPSEGWKFLGWEGDIESSNTTIELAVLDPGFEPKNPFSVQAVPGGGYIISWGWSLAPDITYHPEVVAYGGALELPDISRETAGDLLMDKFASRQIRAVFEKDY